MTFKQELKLAKIGRVLTMLMALVMLLGMFSPRTIPDTPHWLDSMLILICVNGPLLFTSILSSRVPSYRLPPYETDSGVQVEEWKSDPPTGIKWLMIGITAFVSIPIVLWSFFPDLPSIKDAPTANLLYGIGLIIMLLALFMETMSINSWLREFHNEIKLDLTYSEVRATQIGKKFKEWCSEIRYYHVQKSPIEIFKLLEMNPTTYEETGNTKMYGFKLGYGCTIDAIFEPEYSGADKQKLTKFDMRKNGELFGIYLFKEHRIEWAHAEIQKEETAPKAA
jgi:hypothetical protein